MGTALGLLLHEEGERTQFLGTCFAFRSRQKFLTAAHCVGKLEASQVSIALPRVNLEKPYRVSGIERHPKADIAVLALAGTNDDAPSLNPVLRFAAHLGMGEHFVSFGFPEDVFGPDAGQPTARFFRGHFQRKFYHRSYRGFEYEAGEMNIPCPGGLSGAPIFRPDLLEEAVGMVTESNKSMTVLESVEEIQENGRTKLKTINQSFIEYAVALLLHPHSDWLEQHAPPDPQVYPYPLRNVTG